MVKVRQVRQKFSKFVKRFVKSSSCLSRVRQSFVRGSSKVRHVCQEFVKASSEVRQKFVKGSQVRQQFVKFVKSLSEGPERSFRAKEVVLSFEIDYFLRDFE